MFRSSLVLFFALLLAGLAIAVAIYYSNFNVRFWPLYFCFLIWLVISGLIAQIYTRKKLNKIVDLLLVECNPQKCLAVASKLLDRNCDVQGKANIRLNLSTIYMGTGNTEMAKKMLDQVNVNNNNKHTVRYKSVYYNNLASYYITTHDSKSAREALEKMSLALKEPKVPPLLRESGFHLYNSKTLLCNMEEGNYEGCEQTFSVMLDKAKNNYEKSMCQLTLGKIFINNGKIDKAKMALQYVIDNGNTLYAVEEAKQLLIKI